ncbi:MAG: RHS repeat-associated core domain-containing protein [Gemmatimonadetes bacterium]|nr:RHS repeat-associated core domain-containing protein [Gemmatimonadota bacterium]
MIWAGLLRDSVQVAYDSAFRVKTQTVHGSSTVSFSYDRDGLLVGAGALRLGRSATHGLLLADTLGPVRRSDSYTTRDSLDGTLHQAFAYDSNGNRTSLTTALGTVSSSYDAQDRLTRSATSGGVVTLYAYGSNGELKTKTDSATGAQTRYQYDALGNLLKVVLPTGDSVEYLIDGQNRRVGRKWNGAVTHRWLYQNQLNPIAELDSAGALVSRFVYGNRANVPDYLVRGGAVYRLVTDHLGSVRAVVDTATGAVAQWTSYDAWGNVLADSGSGFQPFGFAGGLTDGATGLVRFGVRDYDPTIGRWTAQDPVGFGGGSSGLHAYAGNDPVNLIDRTGRAPQGTENLGRGWTARVDPFEYGGRSSCEIHVFGPTGEVGVYGPAGWIPKHGGVPTGEVPGVVMNRLNGLTVAELRARGLLGPKGTENIRGYRYQARFRSAGRALGAAGFLADAANVTAAAEAAACNGTSPFDELGRRMFPFWDEFVYGRTWS